jgi:uncharacterized membrane protein YkvA (DUF1232 family)
MLSERFRSIRDCFTAELAMYRRLAEDPRVSRLAKWLLGLAMVYALSPIDLIPDFIPVVGHLDDMVLVPLVIIVALKLIPTEVIKQCREKARPCQD